MELNKIINLNDFLSKNLGDIKNIKINHNKDMIYKICDNVLKNYLINFCDNKKNINHNEYKEYINNIVKYIINNEQNMESIDFIFGLHYHIMNELTLEKIDRKLIGKLRILTKTISGQGLNGKFKKRGFTSPKFLKKEIKDNFLFLNQGLKSGDKKIQLESIIHFILYNLFITHPFDNGNSKVFYIYLDLLLWKYNFFPIFIRNKNFYPQILEIFKTYTPENNFGKLKSLFIKNIVNIYSNYKM